MDIDMIYLTGDTHGDMYKFELFKHLTVNDKLIILGDFGFIWTVNPYNFLKEKNQIKILEDKPYEILFIDGNHENFQRLETEFETEEKYGGEAKKIGRNIFWLRRGEMYIIEGKSFLAYGGAYSIDKNGRKENISWWPQEQGNYTEQRKLLDKISVRYDFDYVITHTAPKDVLEDYLNIYDSIDNTSYFLDEVRKKIKFKKWYFGHFHIDKDFGNYTCLYNTIEPIKEF